MNNVDVKMFKIAHQSTRPEYDGLQQTSENPQTEADPDQTSDYSVFPLNTPTDTEIQLSLNFTCTWNDPHKWSNVLMIDQIKALIISLKTKHMTSFFTWWMLWPIDIKTTQNQCHVVDKQEVM